MSDEELMAAELADFKASGGSALVEMSTPGLRSNVVGIRRLAEKTGIHIVATTGLYTEDSWPDVFRRQTIEELKQFMLGEIRNGIGETGVFPGHIKVAVTDLTRQEENALRAAARAAGESGLSMTVHPGFVIGSDGRRIAKILLEEGVDPGRVIMAHSDAFISEHDLRSLVLSPETWRLRLDYAKELFDLGMNLAYDCFGQYYSLEGAGFILEHDWQRLAAVVALIQAGFSPQIMLGTDTFLKTLTRRFGGEGYCRLTRFVLPTLKEVGVSEYDIRRMTIDNPAALLAH
jgi:phosphotriesterase-related protein